MARKRMFDIEIINQDSFFDLPMDAKALYFLLGMEADDEGFVAPKKVLRLYGGSEDSIKILILKKYLIPFENGVVVITDWKRNNYIDKSRLKETIYTNEKKLIKYDENNGKYVLNDCLTDVKQMLNQNSIEENRLDKSSIDKVSIDKCSSEKNESDSCGDGSIQSDSCVDEIVKFYESNIGLITPYAFEKLDEYRKDFTDDIIIFAMKLAVENDAKNVGYIKAILNNWKSKNVKTLLDAEKENKNRKSNNVQQEKEIQKFQDSTGQYNDLSKFYAN